ncbi:unnamed protein product [Colias eurytheme]|nr:unnamed protein product [Colias eurytheme]
MGKSKSSNTIKLVNNGMVIDKNVDVALAFEDFFSSVPASITNNLNSSSALAETFLRDHVAGCSTLFELRHVTANDIVTAFKTLNLKNTCDLWGMSVNLVNNIIENIANNLAFIFNKCCDYGTFPNLLKLSKVIPLFKKGDQEDCNNYRPISILPTLSKVFEKLILNQLTSHFASNNLLHTKQFGFTKGRSTTDAGVALLTHIYKAWENSKNALGIFCDLSKAFDCVEHCTLLRKLSHYGIKGQAQNLIASYLHDRIQTVVVNGERSGGASINIGVPQGSILGPFLFLVYQ